MTGDDALDRACRLLRSTPHGDRHTDLERLARGLVGAQFWSVYLPGDRRDSSFVRMQLEQIELARRVIAR